ncbi:putative membrane protein [Rhodopirellula maiorica SM1]|uniref:Putative membrane protein n=1 Tax=Rhodopirellula maiorica SM1 TaxID=1265738 RepID=M5RJP6_9BACT|nr:putative membrane protein [Rhodopirellula maiorica SM1]
MGIGGWNDGSDAVELTQAILRNESGIVIPPSSLVVRSLGFYLIALVPLNYLVFRLFGKLEYAWLTVPVIAIAGAVWVARSAQLDIGFARSQTELAILETQPGYERAHLARVIAIYNSLSSTYDMQFGTVDAVANSLAQSKTDPVDEPLRFQTDFEEGPLLSGVAVGSNQTQMVRAEQIVDLGGSIYLDDETLVNETQYDLLDSFVVVKNAKDQTRLAVVGLCSAGSKTKLRFRDDAAVNVSTELPLQVSRVMNAFLADKSIPTDSSRLVGRIEESLPGMTVTPQAKQHIAETVVLANLRFPPLPEPKSDVNLIGDFRRSLTEPADSELQSEDESEN